jgi:U3 small nucleolar ribonucleoprotein protein IMP4
LILLTTSHRPTRRIRTFCKDFSHSIPNIIRINRGKLSLEGLAVKALELGADRVIIVDRWKGGPGKIELFKVKKGKLQPTPPLIYVRGVKLRREFGTMPRGRRIKSTAILAFPEAPQEVIRLGEIFSEFFQIPIVRAEEEKRHFSALMEIKKIPAGEIVVTFNLLPESVEIGPLIRISHMIWDLGYEG